MQITDSDRARFLSKIEKTDGCWEWKAGHSGNGYAQFDIGPRPYNAHRISYMIHVGPVADDMVIDHLCRNINCVNPAHLEAVTRGENVKRGESGKHWSAKTHCPHGHEYTPENTYTYRGSRQCRTCARRYKQAYKAKMRSK